MDAESGNYFAEAAQEIKGDIIANGLMILPHRQEIVDFSTPTFPTGVGVIAPANSQINPIHLSCDMSPIKGITLLPELVIESAGFVLHGFFLLA